MELAIVVVFFIIVMILESLRLAGLYRSNTVYSFLNLQPQQYTLLPSVIPVIWRQVNYLGVFVYWFCILI